MPGCMETSKTARTGEGWKPAARLAIRPVWDSSLVRVMVVLRCWWVAASMRPRTAWWLLCAEELVQDTGACVDGRDGDAFVDAVEHAREIKAFGKPQWRETIAIDAQLGESFGVGGSG